MQGTYSMLFAFVGVEKVEVVEEHWKGQIALADWGAAKFLLKLLNDMQKFDELLGRDGKLFLLVDGEMIVSFVTAYSPGLHS